MASHANLVDETHPSSHIPVPATHQPVTTAATDFGTTPSNDRSLSPLSQSNNPNYGRFNEEWDASQRGSSIVGEPAMQRSTSVTSQGDTLTPSRGGTLKKKASLKRGSSLKRSGSRRSSKAGSVRSLALQPEPNDELRSVFFSPVPTTGNPTEILANRFSLWRKVLKDLITYFREIQTQYEHKAKSVLKVTNVINNTAIPNVFLQSGGIGDALDILRSHHKDAITAANKSKEIENDVILALTGLRSDLQQKIKEIKNLSGDFKNSVDKEMDVTRKAVQGLQSALGQSDVDSSQTTGRNDPYLLRLAVDHQVEKQIDEENYLHQAYLNLETSGRELEAIVVGEIQKSYNAYAGILKREADEAYNVVESLRAGPIAMPKDAEWQTFVESDDHFVDPRIPIRQAEHIQYPGRDHELASEVRAGLLERKSKYLKSYTPGWYVLSPTHLHEFKSADKSQAPIMSLYLPEQKLGSHSTGGGASNKFMLKGRQTGSMHRGHSWVFRAESYDTMMAWYEDIRKLTETSPQERTAFVRQHARSVSGTSQKAASISSDGAMDEEDEEPFSAAASAIVAADSNKDAAATKRPEPGGRFPSDIQVNAQRGLQVPLSPSSGSSGFGDANDRSVVAAAADLPGSGVGEHFSEQSRRMSAYGDDQMSPNRTSQLNHYAKEDGVNPYTSEPVQTHDHLKDPALDAALGTAAGIAATNAYREYQADNAPELADVGTIPENRNLAHRDAPLSPSTTDELQTLAAVEAATIAAPDGDLVTGGDSKSSPFMTGGRSQGDLTNLNVARQPFVSADTAGASTAIPSTAFGTGTSPQADATFARPTLAEAVRAGQHHESVLSISQLHVPGEYPKKTSAGM
ncbi:MAG: hypothetical protein M1818_003118 [Claussenomyces sp. TS43310]|nr:MAG: hypothetical protein M1818_003118 [Claussenomyces sp. TS43310]